jgi:hypothetical protein
MSGTVAATGPSILAPSRRARTRKGRLLAPLSLLWAFAVVMAVELVPSILQAPRPPALLHDALLVLAPVPLGYWLLSAVVGPRRGMRWLFESEQPRAVVDGAAVTLRVPRRGERILVHGEIGGLERTGGLRGGFRLTDLHGATLARVPQALINAVDLRTGARTSFAAAVVRHRPDRFVAIRGRLESLPRRFRLRRAEEPATDWQQLEASGRWLSLAAFAVACLVAGGLVLAVIR